jgi:hypothetical protein
MQVALVLCDTGIERPAASPTAAATDPSTTGAVLLKARTPLGSSMGAAVMRGDDLQVRNLPATIPVLVLDADIRELDVFVLVWQPVR